MSYYTALQAAWNNVTQPPAGVTGSGLLAGDTTAQKLAKLNAWTVTGSVPTVLSVTGNQILNCINYAEFKALPAAQQQNLLLMCACPGLLLGGSSNTAFMVDGILLDYFTNHAGPTILALMALAQSTTQSWWQANGYLRAFDLGDIATAGLS
jgi:hypothetical protein